MRLVVKNWLMRLWRLGSPTICCLPAGDPGKQVVYIPARAKGLRSKSANGVSPSLRMRRPMSQLEQTGRDTHCHPLPLTEN